MASGLALPVAAVRSLGGNNGFASRQTGTMRRTGLSTVLAATAAGLLIAGLGLLAWRESLRSEYARSRIVGVTDSIVATHELDIAVRDAEAGANAYLAFGRQQDIARYQAAIGRFRDLQSRISTLPTVETVGGLQVPALDFPLRQRLDSLPSAPLGTASRALLPELERDLAEAAADRKLLLSQWRLSADQAGYETFWLTAAGTFLAVLLMGLFAWLARSARSERDRTRVALRESEERFRAVADVMPQCVWAARPDGGRNYHNQRWFDFTGAVARETEGDKWLALVHPDDRARTEARWREAVATGHPYQTEHRLRASDGTYRWSLTRALPIRDEHTGEIARWFGTCTDITDVVALREALARAREELVHLAAAHSRDLNDAHARLAQAQRVEALGQLAGGIAHDFNNVLQAVQSTGAMIAQRPDDAEGVARHARVIQDTTDRGIAITRRLLAFSRRGQSRDEAIRPFDLLEEMKELLAHTMPSRIRIDIVAARELPPLRADRSQLQTVLVNLATNARDAITGTGTLIMAASLAPAGPDQPVGHPALRGDPCICLSVADTGTGMDAATLAHASEPFFTTKPSGQGTGLGLSMARAFAEQSGGAMKIESAPGQGTTIRLWFPLARQTVSPAVRQEVAPARTHPCKMNAPSPQLLLVDDDDVVLEVMTEQMEAIGYRVRAATSGPRALAMLKAGEVVDVIVSDLSMPDMDGITLIREAQQLRPGLPAILLTGFTPDDQEVVVAQAEGEGIALLCKPVPARQLAQRVDTLLGEIATPA